MVFGGSAAPIGPGGWQGRSRHLGDTNGKSPLAVRCWVLLTCFGVALGAEGPAHDIPNFGFGLAHNCQQFFSSFCVTARVPIQPKWGRAYIL